MADNWEKISVDGLSQAVDWNEVKEVAGVLTKITTELGANQSTLYTLKKEDGSDISFWGSKLLDGRLEKVELGTSVKVVFLGMVEGKNGRTYRNYDVFTKK